MHLFAFFLLGFRRWFFLFLSFSTLFFGGGVWNVRSPTPLGPSDKLANGAIHTSAPKGPFESQPLLPWWGESCSSHDLTQEAAIGVLKIPQYQLSKPQLLGHKRCNYANDWCSHVILTPPPPKKNQRGNKDPSPIPHCGIATADDCYCKLLVNGICRKSEEQMELYTRQAMQVHLSPSIPHQRVDSIFLAGKVCAL